MLSLSNSLRAQIENISKKNSGETPLVFQLSVNVFSNATTLGFDTELKCMELLT